MGKRDMAIKQPILIAGSPRSGTTMISALLIKHGTWIGQSRGTTFPETNSDVGTENHYIKNIMKRQARHVGYKNWNTPFPTDEEIENRCDWEWVKDDIESIIPDDQWWLVKTSWLLVFNKFWRESYPDAKWIFPYRNPSDIKDSMNRHPRMRRHPDKQKEDFIAALHARQHTLSKLVKNSLVVNVKKIASLDMVEITKFFDFCGVCMDEKIVLDFIKPEMMHGKL